MEQTITAIKEICEIVDDDAIKSMLISQEIEIRKAINFCVTSKDLKDVLIRLVNIQKNIDKEEKESLGREKQRQHELELAKLQLTSSEFEKVNDLSTEEKPSVSTLPIVAPIMKQQVSRIYSPQEVMNGLVRTKENSIVQSIQDIENTFKIGEHISEEAFWYDFRQMAWSKYEYYYENFLQDVQRLRDHGNNIAIATIRQTIAYLLMFFIRIVLEPDTEELIIYKINPKSKISTVKRNAFLNAHSGKWCPYLEFEFKETRSKQVLKGKKTVIEETSCSLWSFVDLQDKQWYLMTNGYDWIPYSAARSGIDPLLKTRTLNVYMGLRAKVLDGPIDMNCVNKILNHFRKVWAGVGDGKGDDKEKEKIYQFIVSWFISFIKYPERPLPFMLIVGKRRTGKLYQ